MTYWVITAWILGFIGSTHCIGMCGPLALALPVSSKSALERLFQSLVYNLGRVCTYAFYGSLIGITHKLIVPVVLQNQLSVILGIVMILVSLVCFFTSRSINIGTQNQFYRFISQKLGQLYQQPSTRSLFLIGVLNGLLPCGLVYLALATAFASGTVLKSVLFMGFFGLGTLPAMWGIVYFANMITPAVRSHIKKFVPLLYVIAGIVLILRGLGENSPLHSLMPSMYCSNEK